MYERLKAMLEDDDEPDQAARRVLEALREPTPEVLQSGLHPRAWRAAVEAMLAVADAADSAQAEADAESRRQRWPLMRRQLEKAGCRVWRVQGEQDVWQIAGLSVEAEVDLATGEVTGLEGGIDPRSAPFDQLVELITWEIEHKEHALADKARKAKLREGHDWDNKRKGWFPRSGDGPIIPGGGSV